MINTLEIHNFKCFENLKLQLGTLTLLTGYNAAGKSSAIQPLLLLAQVSRFKPTKHHLALNGAIVRLGTVGDVLPANSSLTSLQFTVTDDRVAWTWRATARAGERHFEVMETSNSVLGQPGQYDSQESSTTNKGLLEIISRLSYLSAIRMGPEDSYPPLETFEGSHVDVGIDGRYAPYWYDMFVDDDTPKARCHPAETATSFRKQLDAWLSMLFPNAQANVQHSAQLSLYGLQFRIAEFGDWRRPANVGYGFSYAFPILVALLASEQEQVIVIDSPEAHLHPFAQSQMGKIIAHFAAAGVQIILETHSDHLLNGLRLAVKEDIISSDKLKLYFFSGASESSNGVLSLNVDREGRIDNWPEGFFDQSERDLARLSGWE